MLSRLFPKRVGGCAALIVLFSLDLTAAELSASEPLILQQQRQKALEQ